MREEGEKRGYMEGDKKEIWERKEGIEVRGDSGRKYETEERKRSYERGEREKREERKRRYERGVKEKREERKRRYERGEEKKI